jgi:signal transduction histidine kinase
VRELRDAENALQSMQTQLTGALRQRERLAQLGEAVAKISHDLRNILSVTTLMADRLEGSADPAVQRATPKILAISHPRGEPDGKPRSPSAAPRSRRPSSNACALPISPRTWSRTNAWPTTRRPDDASPTPARCPPRLVLRADPEQLHRVLSNLVRNARQAIAATGKAGEIRIVGRSGTAAGGSRSATPAPACRKRRSITCSSRSTAARARAGTGLGLAIAAEIVRGHGGTLELCKPAPRARPSPSAFPRVLPS